MSWASARAVCESTNRTLLKIDSSGEMTNITNVIMPHVEMVIFMVIDSSGKMTNICNVIMPHVEMVIFTVIDNSDEMTNITNVVMLHVEMVRPDLVTIR
jgi:hypothetical protein